MATFGDLSVDAAGAGSRGGARDRHARVDSMVEAGAGAAWDVLHNRDLDDPVGLGRGAGGLAIEYGQGTLKM